MGWKSGLTALAGAQLGLALSFASMPIPLVFSEPINNEEHLRRVIVEEAKNLGLNSENISGRFDRSEFRYLGFGTAQVEKKDGRYEIVLDDLRTRGAIKHELYHIYDRAFDDIGDTMSNEINEMQANLYANLGLKTSFR